MIRNFSEILGAAGFVFAIAVCLLALMGASKAQELTACGSDAFLCSSAVFSITDSGAKIAPI
jgi:hypothetical protein